MAVFWVVAPCSLVEVCRSFRGAYRLYHQGYRPDDGDSTSETSVNFYETTRRKILEKSRLHTRRRENLKSHSNEIIVQKHNWISFEEAGLAAETHSRQNVSFPTISMALATSFLWPCVVY
jgi:hypothetical protein